MGGVKIYTVGVLSYFQTITNFLSFNKSSKYFRFFIFIFPIHILLNFNFGCVFCAWFVIIFFEFDIVKEKFFNNKTKTNFFFSLDFFPFLQHVLQHMLQHMLLYCLKKFSTTHVATYVATYVATHVGSF